MRKPPMPANDEYKKRSRLSVVGEAFAAALSLAFLALLAWRGFAH